MISFHIAENIHRISSVSETAKRAAERAILDLMTAAIAGKETPGAKAAMKSAAALWPAGDRQVWFSPERLPLAAAAFVNSTTASALDLDDGHRASAGHPGAAIVPAVLAAAEGGDVSGDRILTAIAIGYEVSVRIGSARDLTRVTNFATGVWCGQGVAAALAWLRGLSVEQTANALAIAGTSAPSLYTTSFTKDMGNNVKEGIPWATVVGIYAVEMAANGSTGPKDFLDEGSGYLGDPLTAEWGGSWLIEGSYFKPYSCCRWCHAAIDAALAIQKETGWSTQQMDRIEVHTFEKSIKLLNNECSPKSLESGQYSTPFTVALALERGVPALLPMQQEALNVEAVEQLATRVSLHVDPRLDAMFSKAVPARVVIVSGSEQKEHEVLAPLGEPSNPMDWDLLVRKQVNTAGLYTGVDHLTALQQSILALVSEGSSELYKQLARVTNADGNACKK